MKVSNKYTFLRMIIASVWFALFYIPELFKFKTGSVANIVFSVVLIAMLGFMEIKVSREIKTRKMNTIKTITTMLVNIENM